MVLPLRVITSFSVKEYCGATFQFLSLFTTERRTMSCASGRRKSNPAQAPRRINTCSRRIIHLSYCKRLAEAASD